MKKQKIGSIDHLYFGSWLSGCMALCCTKSQVKESIKVGFVYIGDESNPYGVQFYSGTKKH